MDKSSTDNNILVISLLDDAYACRINNLKRSVQLSQKALALSRDNNDEALIGRSLNQLALFSMIMGEYQNAISFAEEAIKYFEKLNAMRCDILTHR